MFRPTVNLYFCGSHDLGVFTKITARKYY